MRLLAGEDEVGVNLAWVDRAACPTEPVAQEGRRARAIGRRSTRIGVDTAVGVRRVACRLGVGRRLDVRLVAAVGLFLAFRRAFTLRAARGSAAVPALTQPAGCGRLHQGLPCHAVAAGARHPRVVEAVAAHEEHVLPVQRRKGGTTRWRQPAVPAGRGGRRPRRGSACSKPRWR